MLLGVAVELAAADWLYVELPAVLPEGLLLRRFESSISVFLSSGGLVRDLCIRLYIRYRSESGQAWLMLFYGYGEPCWELGRVLVSDPEGLGKLLECARLEVVSRLG